MRAWDEEPQDWFFTFGSGIEEPHRMRFVRIRGTQQGARQRMFDIYGDRWCGQYQSADDAGVEKFGLIELDPYVGRG